MSAIPARYDASWIPGLKSDFDPDKAIALGADWLRSQAGVKSRVVVMNTKGMIGNRRSLGPLASQFLVASPLSRDGGDKPRAVLAIWPARKALTLAEDLALDGALCVIPGNSEDVTHWIVRAGAINLLSPDDKPPKFQALSDEVRTTLDSLCFLGGHNDFYGGGEKESAIPSLRRIAASVDRPTPQEIEDYVLASGKTGPTGAGRLREWYEGLLENKRFKDYRGRYI